METSTTRDPRSTAAVGEPAAAPRRLDVGYRAGTPRQWLDDPHTLAVFGFGAGAASCADPRHLRVLLEPLGGARMLEVWKVDAPVRYGCEGALNWAAGGGWLFASVEVAESDFGGLDAAAERAYRQLADFTATRPEHHVLRAWNYLGAINEGYGDGERYKQFCSGRARGMDGHFADGYPAATAIGHKSGAGIVQVYWLASIAPGQRVENPRQLSAWRYPRQYGPTPPKFARAMRLPHDALAISGTAAVVGHQSLHHDDLDAQIGEMFGNLATLAEVAGRAFQPNATTPLKVYVREPDSLALIEHALARRLDDEVPRLLLAGDICRRELLIEIDGWMFAEKSEE